MRPSNRLRAIKTPQPNDESVLTSDDSALVADGNHSEKDNHSAGVQDSVPSQPVDPEPDAVLVADGEEFSLDIPDLNIGQDDSSKSAVLTGEPSESIDLFNQIQDKIESESQVGRNNAGKNLNKNLNEAVDNKAPQKLASAGNAVKESIDIPVTDDLSTHGHSDHLLGESIQDIWLKRRLVKAAWGRISHAN